MPTRRWPFSPATRTMKNSLRLFAEIERKRTRSSRGWRGLDASSSTRSLKASHDSSRLMKRAGERKSNHDVSPRFWGNPRMDKLVIGERDSCVTVS